MKILVVSQYFWPEEFRINDLVRSLVERGHVVDVLTGLPNYPQGHFFSGYSWRGPWKQKWQGATIYRSWLWPRGKAGSSLSLLLNYFFFVVTATWVGLIRLNNSYDTCLVFSTSPITSALPAIFLKKRLGYKLHIWIQDLWPDSLDAVNLKMARALKPLAAALVRFIYSHCEGLMVQSEGFRQSLVHHGASADRIVYAPNWADTLLESAQPPSSPTSANRFNIVFAGNLGRAQSLQTILQAAAILRDTPDIHWHFVGDGSLRQQAENQIAELNLAASVTLHPRLPSADMPKLFAEADALLVTLRRSPILAVTVPSKIQAYLAAGRPILAAIDGEGARIVNESAAGLTSPAEDSHALAENALKLSKIPLAARERMGQGGRRYYSQYFSQTQIINRIESHFAAIERGDHACG